MEDFAYQKRLQLYKGEIGPEDVLSADADPLDVATQGEDHPCPSSLAARKPPNPFCPCPSSKMVTLPRWPGLP